MTDPYFLDFSDLGWGPLMKLGYIPFHSRTSPHKTPTLSRLGDMITLRPRLKANGFEEIDIYSLKTLL